MTTKKQIIGNELIQEIVAIRFHTLTAMLRRYKEGRMPGVYEEGATSSLDNKGAIFIPGGLIYQDVDEQFIRYDSYGEITAREFRHNVRAAMRYDNAILLYHDGIVPAVNLDGGFFSRAARRIFTYRKAAFRRTKKVSNAAALDVSSNDIIKSHCPAYMKPPYGARTRISTCVSVGLIDPPMYYAYNKTELNFSIKQARRFVDDLEKSREVAHSAEGLVLFPPYVVVCHDTRYKRNSFTGLTRILGIGAFGEFATFSFELLEKDLTNELQRKKQTIHPEDIFAFVDQTPILGVLRIYERTNPGRRILKYRLSILSREEVGITSSPIY